MEELSIKKIIGFGALGVVAFIGLGILGGSWYTIEQGERGVVKRFGEVTSTATPGLNFKVPFIDNIEKIEVRTRKAVVENEPTSTVDQLPSQADISVNWTVDSGAVAQLYTQYGSIDTFEQRVLYPRIRSAVKVAVAKYTAEEVNRNRNLIVGAMTETLRNGLETQPLTIDSVQLEDITFPRKYVEAIEAKQTELQRAKEEEHRLARQKLQAQQAVNTAEAEAEAKRVAADAEAYRVEVQAKADAERIRLAGEANASAVKARADALKANPILVELTKAENWNGQLPVTNFGDSGSGAGFLIDIRENK